MKAYLILKLRRSKLNTSSTFSADFKKCKKLVDSSVIFRIGWSIAYLMFLLDLPADICHILEQLADLVRVLRPQPAHFQHDTLLILTSGIRKLYKIRWRMNKVSHHILIIRYIKL